MILAFLCQAHGAVLLHGLRKRLRVLNGNPHALDAINPTRPRVNLVSKSKRCRPKSSRLLCGLILVLRRLRRVEYMLREREHFRTDLQMCIVGGAKIDLKLKRTLLQREADSPPVRQKIRSLTDR